MNMVQLFIPVNPGNKILLEMEKYPQKKFQQRCDLIHAHLNVIQKESGGSRIKVLWCSRSYGVSHFQRRPFNHMVSVRFMHQGFPYFNSFPSAEHLIEKKYDVVVFEDVLSKLPDVFAINQLMWIVSENGGLPILVFKPSLSHLSDFLSK